MLNRVSVSAFSICHVFLLTGAAFPQTCGEVQSSAIPSYYYPGDGGQVYWDRTVASAPTVDLVVINPGIYLITPLGGTPYTPDPNYQTQVATSQAAGQLVLGYTHTSYGLRPIEVVKEDIDIFYEFYNVDGIFVDEASTDCYYVYEPPGGDAYYLELYDYIRSKTLPDGTAVRGTVTVLNSGGQTQVCYMSVSDIVLTFEGYYEDPGFPAGQWYKDNYLAPSWVSDFPGDRFWHLVHTTDTSDKMQHAVRLSKDRNVGRIYVTPDIMDNPWDTIPDEPYWTQELSAISPIPPPPQCVCSPPPTDLVAWWPGDGTADDLSDGNHNGTVFMVHPEWYEPFTVGKVGKAFSLGFGGWNDYIDFGTEVAISGTGPFTLDAWVSTIDETGVILQQRDASESGWMGQYVLSVNARLGGSPAPGQVCWAIYGTGEFGFNFCSASRIDDGIFHHIAAVREADGTGKIYIDGALDTSQTGTSQALAPLGVYAGGDRRDFDDPQGYLTAIIDEIEIINRALSLAEVSAIYQAGSAGKCKAEIIVAIDIKPGSFPNSINLGSGGNVPVAIFGTTIFDVTTVEPTTVTLASAPVRLRGKAQTPMTSYEDVNEDGHLDLVVHVETQALAFSETDNEALLEGQTADGTPIKGWDTVRVVP